MTSMTRIGWVLTAAALVLGGCRTSGPQSPAVSGPHSSAEAVATGAEGPAALSPKQSGTSPDVVRFTLLHLNDVYEIGAVEGGRRGGLARVATLRNQLIEENPSTLVVHAGDMLSPSAMGTAKVDGERLAGRQMVSVLNSLGLDLATLGNHEFDLKEQAFRDRLEESDFQWVSANVTNERGIPFDGIPGSKIYSFDNEVGKTVRVAFVGVVLEEPGPTYRRIGDPVAALRREIKALRGKADVIVGLTHLRLDQDATVAETVPEVDLILGGHEHENYQLRRGPNGTPILKGDANARSVFVHRLAYDTASGELGVDSEFLPVDASLAEDPAVAEEVEHWTKLAFDGFRSLGFEPDQVVAEAPIPLDGREASVRTRSTELTDLIARGMKAEVPDASLAFYNSGSIRIDDELPAGPVTQYDVIRVLPFGGPVTGIKIRGRLLKRVLEQGVANRGTGGYLQTAGAQKVSPGGPWEIAGSPLDPDVDYIAGISDFLLTGREQGLDFFTPEHQDLEVLGEFRDVRLVFIEELQRAFSDSP